LGAEKNLSFTVLIADVLCLQSLQYLPEPLFKLRVKNY
jgi:hypothetical protein